MLVATSWDDGLVTDFQLMKILEKYSATASFALNLGMHENEPSLNDKRYIEYGYRVGKKDLLAYEPFDICNHTFIHTQMDTTKQKAGRTSIRLGKERLEELFERVIAGIVWPFGISTEDTRDFAKNIGHVYGRTTPFKPPNTELWDMIPISWRADPENIIKSDPLFVLFSGHTYEMQSQMCWDQVDEFYRILSTDPRCELISMTELAMKIHAK